MVPCIHAGSAAYYTGRATPRIAAPFASGTSSDPGSPTMADRRAAGSLASGLAEDSRHCTSASRPCQASRSSVKGSCSAISVGHLVLQIGRRDLGSCSASGSFESCHLIIVAGLLAPSVSRTAEIAETTRIA